MQLGTYTSFLEVKRKYYQNSSVLDCVTQCSQSAAHMCEQFLQIQQIGFVTLGPLRCARGGCLELYYCNMVEWYWWDSSLISTTNWFPSVRWHCWFGHLACKNRPRNDLLCVEWDVKPYTLTPWQTKFHNFPPQWEPSFFILPFVFCCFLQVSDMHSHLLSCLHLEQSDIKSFICP